MDTRNTRLDDDVLANKVGLKLIKVLNIKLDADYLVDTQYGFKNPKGIARVVEGILIEELGEE